MKWISLINNWNKFNWCGVCNEAKELRYFQKRQFFIWAYITHICKLFYSFYWKMIPDTQRSIGSCWDPKWWGKALMTRILLANKKALELFSNWGSAYEVYLDIKSL